MRLLSALACGFILGYRYLLSPLWPGVCRFEPTCSAYGLEAIRRHGALGGGWLTLARLARCHPWANGGIDPVPDLPSSPGWRRVQNTRRPCDRP
ncbi:MAG: membrane protein insertion efficiency factor YidD [Defluviicoccus sp.]